MRKLLIVSALALVGVLGSGSKASAFCWGGWWTCGSPVFCGYPYGGCGTGGCYYYPPYYPWFAYYNYSASPYAWPNGYNAANYPAYVPGVTDRPPYSPKADAATASSKAEPATVTATLPADAELLFNGTKAEGATGTTRSFQTAPLAPGQAYEYTLTARVIRNGQAEIVTEKVVVKAGEQTKVTLMPKGDATAVAAK